MKKYRNPKLPNRYQWGTDEQEVTSNTANSLRENSTCEITTKTTSSATSFSSKEVQRRKQTDRKLKKYGRQTEVKLCKNAIDGVQQETMKYKHEEKCRQETAALKRKEDSLAKKKKVAQNSQQISKQIKSLKDSYTKTNGSWPNTLNKTDL